MNRTQVRITMSIMIACAINSLGIAAFCFWIVSGTADGPTFGLGCISLAAAMLFGNTARQVR